VCGMVELFSGALVLADQTMQVCPTFNLFIAMQCRAHARSASCAHSTDAMACSLLSGRRGRPSRSCSPRTATSSSACAGKFCLPPLSLTPFILFPQLCFHDLHYRVLPNLDQRALRPRVRCARRRCPSREPQSLVALCDLRAQFTAGALPLLGALAGSRSPNIVAQSAAFSPALRRTGHAVRISLATKGRDCQEHKNRIDGSMLHKFTATAPQTHHASSSSSLLNCSKHIRHRGLDAAKCAANEWAANLLLHKVHAVRVSQPAQSA
jgi:hypothetical protein